jgi:hypothetical protein
VRAPRELVRVVDAGGAIGAAERVVDTVELMFRRGQVDARQRSAAAIYLDAVERVGGVMPSCLDTSRVGGGGAAAASPTERQLLAAAHLAQAAQLLGRLDARILASVVAEGRTIAETAARLFGRGAGKPRRVMVEHVGQRLRLALDVLAGEWVRTGSWR